MSHFVYKLFKSLIFTLTLLTCIIVFRAIVFFPMPKPQVQCRDDGTHKPIDNSRGEINRFVAALKFKTITYGIDHYSSNELTHFVDFIIKSFPKLHSSPFVSYEIVNNHSLLYSIQGSDKSLKPYLLTGHMDVVIVEEDKWEVNPFAGVIKEGFIYGRGSIDDKNTVMSILETLEFLLENDFRPKRSFFVGFGHDEEALGFYGAKYIAQTLVSKGVRDLEYVLDEGMPINDGIINGIDNLIASVGVVEKGYLTLKLTADGPVGHSSMAPYETSIVTLAKAVSKFTSDTHKNLFGFGPEWGMFEAIAPFASYPTKLVFSNLWLFAPILSYILSLNPITNGIVRTTTAATMIDGGVKFNVLPSSASVIINHRIHPSQSVAEIIEYDRKLINDDRISIEIMGHAIEPHPVSPYDHSAFGFQIIKKSVGQIFPNAIVIPGIMVGATDTRWYLNFTRAVYRFAPTVMKGDDMKRFHGHNERISIDNYINTINYFHHIILNSNEKEISDNFIPKDEL